MQNTPSDFGKKMADKIMGGLGGDLERAKVSVENFTLAVGNAIEPLARLALKTGGDALDKVSNAPEKVSGYGAGVAAIVGTTVSSVIANAVGAKFALMSASTGAGAVADGLAVGALAGVALSDISKDFIKATPDFAKALTSNPMLGANGN